MIKQNTREWLEERKKYLGASDAPVVMQKSPWKTPFQLFMEKSGFGVEQEMNIWMNRGHELEPIAREVDNREFDTLLVPSVEFSMEKSGFGVEQEMNIWMTRGHELEPIAREIASREFDTLLVPSVEFSSEYDFMMASLDGIDFDRKYLVEIKCPGKKTHQMALDGEIPEMYKYQMMHQLIVTGMTQSYYMSYMSDMSWKILEFHYDQKMADELISAEKKFWSDVIDLNPPEMTNRDYIERSDSEWLETAAALKETALKRKELEGKEKQLKERLQTLAGNQSCRGGGISACQIIKKGTIIYKNIPELENVDLEKHRGKTTTYWRIA